MSPARPALERRIVAGLEASPPRVPVLLGHCGAGRTSLLRRLHDQLGHDASVYVDVERVTTTPERFYRAVTDAAPFSHRPAADVRSARQAFDGVLAFVAAARTASAGRVTFLLDEVLEVRTFESFPGLRTVLQELFSALATSSNRFVLATRYIARAHRLLRDTPAQFEVIHVPPLNPAEVRDTLQRVLEGNHPPDDPNLDDMGRAVHALSDGHPAYVRAIGSGLAEMNHHGGGDPVSALAAQLAPEGDLFVQCRFSYELRLHRARGYGALKAILDILTEEEPLTLTQIAQRLRRTPGSTKDYLSWLEDVDLVTVHQKRYSFADSLLRLWVRLHCRAAPPSDEQIAREVQAYALARLPRSEPALAYARTGAGTDEPADEERKPWGIIEID